MEEKNLENQLSEEQYKKIVSEAEKYKTDVIGGRVGKSSWCLYFSNVRDAKSNILTWLEQDRAQRSKDKHPVLKLLRLNLEEVTREHLFYLAVVSRLEGKDCLFFDSFGNGPDNQINKLLLYLNIKV